MFDILTPNEAELIHQASLEILEKIGARIHDNTILEVISEAGGFVDYSKEIVKVPPRLIEEAIDKAPKSIRLCGMNKSNDIELLSGRTFFHSAGGNTHLIDPQTRTVRLAVTGDLVRLVRLVDSLPVHVCEQIVFPSDVPPEIADLCAFDRMLRNTEKPLEVIAYSERNLEHMIQLAEIVTSGQLRNWPILSIYVSPTSPLAFSADVLRQLSTAAKTGLPIWLGPCPLAGATSPVTLAGTVAQMNAECLIENFVVQLLNPGNSVIASAFPCLMDMRTGRAAVGAVEAGLMCAAHVQVSRRYEIPTEALGFGTDSMVLDEQTGFEKAIVAMPAVLAGANLLGVTGAVESDVTVSYEQLVIDNEIYDMLIRASRGIEVSQETLAINIIGRVGPSGHFLANKHTRKNLLTEQMMPKLCNRRSRPDWEKAGSKDIVSAAKERVEELLTKHECNELDPDVQRDLDKAMEKAKAELVQSN